jgi:HEAT repeat protein
MKTASLASVAGRRGRMGVAFALVAALGLLCWWTGLLEREPSFQGKSATDWLDSVNDGANSTEATAAFKAMGPSGVRFLARTLEAKPVQLPDRAERLIDKLDLPEWANPARKMEYHAAQLSYREEAALNMLSTLGRAGAPALRTLVRLFRDGNPSESYAMAELMAPMAGQLEFMAPELIEDLRQHKPNDLRCLADITVLGAIGPKAKDAVPLLLQMARGGDPATAARATVALWSIARDTNALIGFSSNSLGRHDFLAYSALFDLERAVPLPQAMVPVLEKALRHPLPLVRGEAEFLLRPIDPDRLRQIAEELNNHQTSLLREHLKLLESSNYLDRLNALGAIQFMGPQAASAVPRLAQIICLGRPALSSVANSPLNPGADMFAALQALREIGPGAAAATPVLLDLLQTNGASAPLVLETLSSFGPDAGSAIPGLRSLLATNSASKSSPDRGHLSSPERQIPTGLFPNRVLRWAAARALASIDRHDSNAIEMLREAATSSPHHRRYFPDDDGRTRLSASVSLWKLGLQTNLPVDELIAEIVSPNHSGWAVDLLGEIGPPAQKALPELEKNLKARTVSRDLALAIRKIDPAEATRLGLPGLFIICPDKY